MDSGDGNQLKVNEWKHVVMTHDGTCLLYTSDAADERSSVDLGGRRIIKKKTDKYTYVSDQRNSNNNIWTSKHTKINRWTPTDMNDK